MASQLLEKPSGVTCAVTGIAAAIAIIAWRSRRPNLDAFPTVGSTGLLSSWWGGPEFVSNGAWHAIQEGYEKHKSVPFKVVDIYGWIVVLTKHDHLDELRRAPEDVLSLVEATNDRLNTRYTLGDDVHDDPYHIAVIRSQVTRNIGTLYSEMRDEIITAFDEIVDLRGNEWTSVPVLSVMRNVVCRASHSLFVGKPLCQNQAWIDLNIQYSLDVFKAGAIIGLFPKFMRPLAACLFPAVAQDIARGVKLIGPIIEERLKHLDECQGNWTDKPNDVISWLIEGAGDTELTVESLTARALLVSLPAIHTTSNSFAQALFYLAANPQYIKPLREEIEAIVEKDGWSRTALGKMRKVDSFLKECQRMEGVHTLSVTRKVMRDFTFSDGTFLPQGTMVAIGSRCLHYDDKFYENADVFNPFRFTEMQGVGGLGAKYRFISTAIQYQPFGHGNHVCPGRFLAATIMKTMLAHIVTTYDIKLEDGATRPRSFHYGTSIIPDPKAKVLFRRRVD